MCCACESKKLQKNNLFILITFIRQIASCPLTHAASFKSAVSVRLPCDNQIINGISQKVLDYFRLEIDQSVRSAHLQKICICYPRFV